MSLYVTPFTRRSRRAWSQPYRDDNWVEVEYDVFVPVNVQSEDDDFIITALLPGVKAEDLNLQILNETVTIQGEFAAPEKDQRFMVREIPSGKFYRLVRLPAQLDSAKAEADLTNGVLTLRVPKAETARPRMIKVSAN